MMFDWVSFLASVGVEFVDRGKNVARGNINVKCPFCVDDPSQHMGIRLEDGVWGCLRDQSHRGKSPIKLVMRLTGWPYGRVKDLVQENAFPEEVNPISLAQRLENLMPEKPFEPKRLSLPKDFRCFNDNPSRIEKRFQSYLSNRGFNPTMKITSRYALRWAVTGRWKHRIIIPVLFEGMLVGWTGRALGKAGIRYDTYPYDETMKHLVYNYDRARGGDLLFLVEGPLDVIKLDWLAYEHRDIIKVNAVGLMGLSLTPGKMKLLNRLRDLYDIVVLLLDRGAEGVSLEMQESLSFLDAEVWSLPSGYGDPGELDSLGYRSLLRSNL